MDCDLTLESCVFLESILNNRSKISCHQDFKLFLNFFSELLKNNGQKIVVKAQPKGEYCNYCKVYIPEDLLDESIRYEDLSYVCSVECMKGLRKIYPAYRSRKNTDDSISSSISDIENPSSSSAYSNCVIF